MVLLNIVSTTFTKCSEFNIILSIEESSRILIPSRNILIPEFFLYILLMIYNDFIYVRFLKCWFSLEVFFFVDTHATSINKHGLNSVYAIINIFLTAKPINITHMWHPVLFSLIYVVFSVIHQLGFGVPPIYTVLDWSKPTTALLTSVPLVFIGVPLCHVMFFILYRTRCVIFRKCCLEKDKAETSTRHSDLQDE